jgi:hypothetical protein
MVRVHQAAYLATRSPATRPVDPNPDRKKGFLFRFLKEAA